MTNMRKPTPAVSFGSRVLGTTALSTRISAMLLLAVSFGYSPRTTTSGFVVSPPRTATTSLQSTKPVTREIYTSADLESSWGDDANEAACLAARGNTQIIGSPDHPGVTHPVIRVLHDRKRRRQQAAAVATEKKEEDGGKEPKIALVIEGGGMRGCVTAGMVCAIDYLGLRNCVDVVYGSSAGSIIGAYFITGQLPWFGPEVYYDQLTTAGKSFIDTGRLLRALGLGVLNPKLLRDVITRRNSGKPVLDLDFLLQETMQRTKPLDWATFEERQQTNTQPLKIVVSGLKREEPMVLEYGDRHFGSLEEMSRCMHASALLPGIAGPVVNLLVNEDAKDRKPRFVLRNNLGDDDYEPLADALVYAPIPYEAAMADGATHMVVLRSKPDGGDVIGKGGSIGERLVWSRFFLRKNKLPGIYRRLRKQLHKKLYARSVLELNEAAHEDTKASNLLPPTLTVAIPPEIPEIARLEVGREAIFEGVRTGFARAYDALVEDPSQRGRGETVARLYFPDEILDYSPAEMLALQRDKPEHASRSAFEIYLEESGVWPKAWEGCPSPPLGESSDRALAGGKRGAAPSGVP
ncbi:unnamed protein product [Pseudo-nitzschia multistriata]|uniref:PNPLA domain-containing protein n=1 Tax=Pseudo-nitzschia multistriata TaxID=183589 RepID=A0A448YV63_9STRA|nr:unnamed protein product [Pseudo-nitzschia multistriata]